jgi:alanine-synthesizing transaminase
MAGFFSSRTPRELEPNRLSNLIERKRGEGESIIDLTESNPTRVGIDYSSVPAALSYPDILLYEPNPKGLIGARRAVVEYYRARSIEVDEERIFLTASTSEAYTFLFKLLCEPGESVLVPVPSYPLFEHLVRVESVIPLSYPLYFDGAWHIDFPALRTAIETGTRAIVVVSPNNPTGSTLKKRELTQLIEICDEYGLALICDEVFADFLCGDDGERVKSVAGTDEILTFALNGLSKIAGLPQMKLGWVAVNGPPELMAEAIARLEFITDLFLSVGTPVQRALPRLLDLSSSLQGQLRERLRENRLWLEAQLSGQNVCRLLPSEGGWYSIIQVPRVKSEEEMVLDLLERDNLIVHPGYFFDFASEGWLIMSLINRPEVFQEGIERLLRRIDKWIA